MKTKVFDLYLNNQTNATVTIYHYDNYRNIPRLLEYKEKLLIHEIEILLSQPLSNGNTVQKITKIKYGIFQQKSVIQLVKEKIRYDTDEIFLDFVFKQFERMYNVWLNDVFRSLESQDFRTNFVWSFQSEDLDIKFQIPAITKEEFELLQYVVSKNDITKILTKHPQTWQLEINQNISSTKFFSCTGPISNFVDWIDWLNDQFKNIFKEKAEAFDANVILNKLLVTICSSSLSNAIFKKDLCELLAKAKSDLVFLNNLAGYFETQIKNMLELPKQATYETYIKTAIAATSAEVDRQRKYCLLVEQLLEEETC